MDLTATTTLDADDGCKITQPNHPANNNTTKVVPFTNGTLHRHSATVSPASQPLSAVVSYKECLKNHAASIGGHALDGCGEFMPSSSANFSDPRSLKCAACGCHRNFHRLEPQEHNNNHHLNLNKNNLNNTNKNNPTFLSCIYTTPSAPAPLSHRAMSQSTSPSLSSSPSHSPSPLSSPSPPPLSHVLPFNASAPHMLLALGTGSYSALSDENLNKGLNFSTVVLKNSQNHHPKKRHRTKFSKEQKEKMFSFCEKLGWRMQKGDSGLVQEFCNDIKVSRGVFKVWMHNNKNTFRKKSDQVPNAKANSNSNAIQSNEDHNDGNVNANGNGCGGFGSDINHPYNPNGNNNTSDIHMDEDGCVNVHASLNHELSS